MQLIVFLTVCLPTTYSLIQYMLHLRESHIGQADDTDGSPIWTLSKEIALHGSFCNVYLMAPKSIRRKHDILVANYLKLKEYRHQKKVIHSGPNKTILYQPSTLLLT